MEEKRLDWSMAEEYLSSLLARGKTERSVQQYRYQLRRFFVWLQPSLILYLDSATRWQQSMVNLEDLSDSTINLRITAVNGFLEYIGCPEARCVRAVSRQSTELTREEYLLLLRAARVRKNGNAYYTLRLLGSLGMSQDELKYVTVETVRRGGGRWERGGSPRSLIFPETLRRELLDFAAEQGVRQGPILRRRSGAALDGRIISYYLKSMAEAAGVDPQKVSAKSLERLYRTTMDPYLARFTAQATEHLLTTETLPANW